MIVQAQLAVADRALTEQKVEAMQRRGLTLNVTNVRGPLSLIDVVCDRRELQWLMEHLSTPQREAKLVSVHRQDGKLLRGTSIDTTTWTLAAPDDVRPNPVNPNLPPIATRPTQWRPLNQIFGWGMPQDVAAEDD